MPSLLVLGSPIRERWQFRSFGLRFAANFIALLSFAFLNHAHAAEPCINYADYVFALGGVDTGAPGRFAVTGNYAYVADVGGLVVVDVSISSAPQIVRTVAIPASRVEISGSRLYVSSANQGGGIYVLDLADPSDPVIIESLAITGWIYEIEVHGNLLYVGATGGLHILDPEAATPILGTLSTYTMWLVDVEFPYAYAAGGAKLNVVDVSQPAAPFIVGSIANGSIANFVATGSIVCTLEGNGMRVVDVSNPASPTYVSSVLIPGDYLHSVGVSGTLAYICAGNAGLQVVDISDPLLPHRLDEIRSAPDNVRYVAVDAGLVYYTDLSDGLRIADVSNPFPPEFGNVATPGVASAVAIVGTTAYVTDVLAGLQIVDVTDSEAPLIRGALDTPGSAQGISIAGDYAYIADYEAGLQIVDISNSAEPALVGSANTPSRAFDVEVRNGYAYVADLFSGLQVVDVSDPTAPALVTGMPTPGRAVDVALSGNYAYLACKEGGVQIASLTNPTSPVIVGSLAVGDAQEIVVQGQFAYVACGSSGFRMLRVTNPAAPILLSTLPTSNPVTGLAMSEDGSFAFLEIQSEGILIADLFASLPPTVIGHSFTIPFPSHIALAGNRLCVTSENGLSILPGQCTTTTAVFDGAARRVAGLRAWPNPVATSTSLQFELAHTGNVRLDIFDAAGRHVRGLVEGNLQSGPRIVHWDGRDVTGRRAASGLYFARLRTGSVNSTTRVTLLRP